MTTLKKNIAKLQLSDLARDARVKMAASCASDFGRLLRQFIRNKLNSQNSYTLLGLWHLTTKKNSDAIKVTSPDAKCAGMRWLKSRWDGTQMSQEDFQQFLGVVAGTQQFHDDLIQLQILASQMFSENHQLRRAPNISYLLQCMLSAALASADGAVDTEVLPFGVITVTHAEKHHALQLELR